MTPIQTILTHDELTGVCLFTAEGLRVVCYLWLMVGVVALAGLSIKRIKSFFGLSSVELSIAAATMLTLGLASYFGQAARFGEAARLVQRNEKILRGNFEVSSRGGEIVITSTDVPTETILGQTVATANQPSMQIPLEDARKLSRLMAADPTTYPNAKADRLCLLDACAQIEKYLVKDN